MTTPIHVIQNTATNPNKVECTIDMLVANDKSGVVGHEVNRASLLAPRLDAFIYDGKAYVVMPGIIVVYDYFEFMAWTRKEG